MKAQTQQLLNQIMNQLDALNEFIPENVRKSDILIDIVNLQNELEDYKVSKSSLRELRLNLQDAHDLDYFTTSIKASNLIRQIKMLTRQAETELKNA